RLRPAKGRHFAPIACSLRFTPAILTSQIGVKVKKFTFAGVAELVYALVLGTSAARLEGSSPSSST
ncbi:MAG: hypothetical protein UW07_C0008G0026, partial [Candidatus Nomurabacteria bacterium GW2011_GWF2_43_8]